MESDGSLSGTESGDGPSEPETRPDELPRLLMLEDFPEDAHLELRELRRYGLSFGSVVLAADHAEYVAGLEGFRPDIILADHHVPGLTGEESLDLALKLRPGIPFIFVSGTLGEDRAVDLVKRGAWDYVLKDRLSRLGPAVSRSLAEARERRRLERERREALQELQDSEERFRLAFDEALVGMALVDVGPAPGLFLRVNRSLADFLGLPQDRLLGMNLADVAVGEEVESVRATLNALAAGTLSTYRAEQQYLHAGGTVVRGLLNICLVHDHRGDTLYALVSLEDVTARKRAEEALAYRALHDALTGLPNRALLLDHLQTALARAQRTGTLVGVLFIDLDDFKSVNDSFGHTVGDDFLTEVGRRITGSLRETDTAARIGGDEFVVVCEDLTDSADTALVAQRVQLALSAGIPVRGHRVGAPASMGMAISTPDSTAENLLRDADTAMYTAKQQGGRRWEPREAFAHTAAAQMLALEEELRDAIRLDQLRLFYQPTIDLRTGRVTGVEALLRWQHPTRGLVLPQELIHVAERRNLIGMIGSWGLRTACRQAAAWVDTFGDAAPQIAVNISSRQLGGHGLAPYVQHLLEEEGLAPGMLCLEITESQFVGVSSSSTADLRTLSAAGVEIAVDDFGTGFAGFQYLQRLPVDTIKIDRSYTAGLDEDRTASAIVASVITLGHQLDLKIVAEGVETERQRAILQELACTTGQGWLWYPALPVDDVGLLLQEQAHLMGT